MQQILADKSREAAPGHDFFLEHVHFNFAGHRVVAIAVAQAITQQVLGETWHADQILSTEQMAHEVGLTTFDSLEANGHAMTVLSVSPFKNAPDSEQNFKYLQNQVNSLLSRLPPDDQVMFAEIDPNLRQLDLINALAAAYVNRGDYEQALAMFQCARHRRPWEITPYVGLAKCLMSLGRPTQALENVDRALKRAPGNAELLEIRQTLLQSAGSGS